MLSTRINKKLRFELRDWSYLLFAFAGVLVAAIKGFLYAHVLDSFQYALVSYYLLALGVGGLLVGSGVMLRAHTELPAMPRELRGGFMSQARACGLVFWSVVAAVATAIGSLWLDPYLTMLSVIQIFVMFIFTLDVIEKKSDGDFSGYARAVFWRNFQLMGAGLLAGYFSGTAIFAVLSEVVVGVVVCFPLLANWLRTIEWPQREYLVRSLGFVPVALVGALGQYADRMCASWVLVAAAFSKYAYLSLLMAGALAVQQIFNTRLITLLPRRCADDPRRAFAYVMRFSLAIAALQVCLLSAGVVVLLGQWLSATWIQIDWPVAVVFAAGAVCRASDFFSSYLIVMGRKMILVRVQLFSLIIFGLTGAASWLSSSGFMFSNFVSAMALSMAVSTVLLIATCWRVSRATSNR